MELNDLRTVMTVLAFATFVGIVVWAYSGGRRAAFEEASRLPFGEDELTGGAGQPKEGISQ